MVQKKLCYCQGKTQGMLIYLILKGFLAEGVDTEPSCTTLEIVGLNA